MGYTTVALKDKIREMYPEIEKNGIMVGLVFSETKNAYFVNFRKGAHLLSTHLDKKEADECMDNIKCVYLGGLIGRLIKNIAKDQIQMPGMRAGQSPQIKSITKDPADRLNSDKRKLAYLFSTEYITGLPQAGNDERLSDARAVKTMERIGL